MFMTLLLSISLSLDAFAVAAAHGLKETKIPLCSNLIICLISILYFGLSVWLGAKISLFFNPDTAKIIGIVLMGGICFWMFLQVFLNGRAKEKTETAAKTLFELSIKSIGLTFQIIRNPMLSDLDKSKSISPFESIFLGTALSVDSISVGIGYALTGTVSAFAPFLVGLCQFLFLAAGNWIGLRITSRKCKHSDRLQLISAAVMLLLLLARIFD